MNHKNKTLRISEVLEDHEGDYECVVLNDVGEIKREFKIDLIPKGEHFIANLPQFT